MLVHKLSETHTRSGARLQRSLRPGSKQLVDFARTTVEPGSLVRTDGARMIRDLANEVTPGIYLGLRSREPVNR